MENVKISPSMVCADLSQLGQQVRLLDEAGVDLFHWDIMDGVFVHSFCLTPDVIAAGRKFTEKTFDVHMCITDPGGFIPEVAKAGADMLSLQLETTPHLFRAVETIHKLDKKAGIVINPVTPLTQLDSILSEIQMVTVMTVDVGFAGQNFLYPMLKKISDLREMIEKRNLKVDIQVDGQINSKTFTKVLEAGANVLVVGTSGLFTVDKDLKVAVRKVKEEIASI